MAATGFFDLVYRDQRFRFPEIQEPDHVHAEMKKNGGFYEDGLLAYLQGSVDTPGIALDCGANIGNHALFFAGVMGLTTYAIEPVERNLAILRQAIAVNGLLEDIRIIDQAIDEVPGTVSMTLDTPGNFGMYRVGDAGEGEEVPSTTLDTIGETLDAPVRLIKIDVEGFQNNVIRGGQSVIAKDKPVIACELTTLAEYRSFLQLLEPHGYRPIDVFNATPTVVFDARPQVEARPVRVRRRLAKYEDRMAGQKVCT